MAQREVKIGKQRAKSQVLPSKSDNLDFLQSTFAEGRRELMKAVLSFC